VLLSVDGEAYIVAKERLDACLRDWGVREGEVEVLAEVPGTALEGLKCQHPLYEDRESVLVLADYVTAEQGTGCVHTAPGHGEEDYGTALQYDLRRKIGVHQPHITFHGEQGKGVHVQGLEQPLGHTVQDTRQLGVVHVHRELGHGEQDEQTRAAYPEDQGTPAAPQFVQVKGHVFALLVRPAYSVAAMSRRRKSSQASSRPSSASPTASSRATAS